MNEKDPSKQLGTLRIIVAALAMGMVTITLIMQFLPVEPNPSLGTLMMGIALGMACISLIAYVVLRSVVLATARRNFARDNSDIGQAASSRTYFLITLMGAAMAESVGLLGSTAAFITGEHLLLIAPALALFVIAILFPTAGGFARCYQTVTGNVLPAADWPK